MAKGKYLRKKAKPPVILFLLGFLLVLGGAVIYLYPAISNLYVQRHQATVIQSYSDAVETVSTVEMEQAWEAAEIYNDNLMGDPVHDPFVPGSGYVLPDNYSSVLNPDGDGVMGYIRIPKIAVQLPIYHGTAEDVLEKGVGHIEQTALPIGGEGRHSVLTGHRGLPTAVLFSRLDELEIGDRFYIGILDETLAYEVCGILTVLPYELEDLAAVPGEDLVTLVTCTPYGVNTHRLLVQGKRTAYTPQDAQEEASQVTMQEQTMNLDAMKTGVVIGLIVLAVMVVIFLMVGRRRRKGADHG